MHENTKFEESEYKDIEFKVIRPKDRSKNAELIDMFHKHDLNEWMEPIALEDQSSVTYIIALKKGEYLGGACITQKDARKLFDTSDMDSESHKKHLDRYHYLWFASGLRSRMQKKKRPFNPKPLFRLYKGLWEHMFKFIKLKKLDYISLHVSYKDWGFMQYKGVWSLLKQAKVQHDVDTIHSIFPIDMVAVQKNLKDFLNSITGESPVICAFNKKEDLT